MGKAPYFSEDRDPPPPQPDLGFYRHGSELNNTTAFYAERHRVLW